MSADIQITICGDVERERTVAELSHADSGNFIGLVYEDPDGWKEEIQERPLPEPVRAAIRVRP